MNINIKNININSISTLGSMNIGKIVFAHNRSSSMQLPKPYYEEGEVEDEEIEERIPPYLSYPPPYPANYPGSEIKASKTCEGVKK
ncbi:hypothetical protein QGM71_17715 [Virgibacillus sp. C22-A2]|uniref:Uncharacterized protein n=2 Tax=Virgibacillus tibetensis TaxID=3042313 RepID=A0ABU6KJ26_9BACI|nr:hypothetical protein [Virgibacillus sp. C22-A2]